MIACPLCQKLVLLNEGCAPYPGQVIRTLEDHQYDDFYCPTYVDVNPGTRWCHYSRRTTQGCYPEYEAVIPPFHFIWTEGLNFVNIRIFGDNPINWQIMRDIYFAENVTQQDFFKLFKKFSNLRAFT